MNSKKHIYPFFPFESEEIKKERKKAQHNIENDEFIMFLFFRPISIFFSVFIVKNTKITANAITFVMAVIGLLGPILLVFSNTINQVLWISCIYLLLTSLLDVIDGEVARLRKVESKVGLVLDASLWFYYPLMYIMVVFKLSQLLNLSYLMPLLVIIGVFHELFCFFSLYIYDENVQTVKNQSLTNKIIKLPFSKSIYLVVLLPLFYFFGDSYFNNIFIYYTALLSILYVVYGTMSLMKFVSNK